MWKVNIDTTKYLVLSQYLAVGFGCELTKWHL